MTSHAKQRWSERFAHLDPEMEWAKCRRVGKKLKAKIRVSCPAHAWQTHTNSGHYFRISLGGVVFAVAEPETVITVFSIEDHCRGDYVRAEFGVSLPTRTIP